MKLWRVLLHCKIQRSQKVINRKRINGFVSRSTLDQAADDVSPGGNIE
jgi:hypothetical protein